MLFSQIKERSFIKKLTFAFSTIAVILILSVTLFIYLSNQLHTAVDQTANHILPDSMASMRLSEHSALLAATATALSNAQSKNEIDLIFSTLNDLIIEINHNANRLILGGSKYSSIDKIKKNISTMSDSLIDLRKYVQLQLQIKDEYKQAMNQINIVHSELEDTINPVVWGTSSLSRLLGKRTVRRVTKPFIHNYNQHFSNISELLELQTQDQEISSSEKNEVHTNKPSANQNTPQKHTKPEFSHLLLNHDENVEAIFNKLEQALAKEKINLREHYEHNIKGMKKSLDAFIETTIQNMRDSLEIKAEGNQLLSILTTVADANDEKTITKLLGRFQRSRTIFMRASDSFLNGELAKRNPILARNVKTLKSKFNILDKKPDDLFSIRRQQLNIENEIHKLITSNRIIAQQLKSQTEELTNLEQAKAVKLSHELSTNLTKNTILMLLVSSFGIVLTVIIGYVTTRTLDIHEKELYQSNILLENEKERANQMADKAKAASIAKSQFLANMSHEIRTPLNGVLGVCQILQDTPLNKEQKELLETMNHSGHSLLGIINDVLDYSKIESGKIQLEQAPFNLASLIDNLIQLLSPGAISKNLIIKNNIQEQRWSLLGDAIRINQVITNLVGNAIKFTTNGNITISAIINEQTEKTVNFTVSITDTGIGISEEEQCHIFEDFTQADISTTRKYGGTGLGLTISQKIIKLMGGKLEVKSQLGKGSTFSFTLTLDKAKEKIFSRRTEDRKTSHKQSKVLLVEDDRVNQMIAVKMLKKLNCEVIVANNGQEAIDQLSKTTFNIVFMDIQMPIMDGIEATEKIRKTDTKTTIIAMTANVMKDDKEHCLRVGMNDFIPKPVKRDNLDDALSKWLVKTN